MRYDKTSTRENDFKVKIKSILLGAAAGAVVCTVFLFLFAFFFSVVKTVPQFMIQGIAVFCAVLGAFVAGYTAVRMYRSKGLMYGALSGFLLFLVITIVAFIASRDKFTYLTIIRMLLMVTLGAVGGVIGVNRKRRK